MSEPLAHSPLEVPNDGTVWELVHGPLPLQEVHTSEPRISAPLVVKVIDRSTMTLSRYRQGGTFNVPPVGVASISDCSVDPHVGGGIALLVDVPVSVGVDVVHADAFEVSGHFPFLAMVGALAAPLPRSMRG
jgi:hypothetical protein